MRVAREGVPFILLPLVLAALTSSFGWVWVGGACFIAALKMAFFFRDPVRQTPQDDKLIYSPADGKVIGVEKVSQAENAEEEDSVPFPATRVSIFLSLFNVHITRAPIAVTVTSIASKPGRYIAAYKADASDKNARVSVHIQGDGTEVFFRQVSGSLARRVRSYVQEGDTLRAGQKTGIIYFGSRVDIFLPGTLDISIRPGLKVRAGETVIAERPQ
jgi:phosphatidylserine decarboxylase